MILVTGATGPVGSQVVTKLTEAKVDVRALTRDPKAARFTPEVEVVEGDLGDPDSLRRALEGVDRLFALMPTFGKPEGRDYDRNLAQAAAATGVRHIVRLSVLAAEEPQSDDPHTTYHLNGEREVRDSGVPWTFLRPGQFMTNALSWAETIKSEGFVREPYAHIKQAPIDPADIAACAVGVLTSDSHEGRAYPLSGPESLSIEEQVARLAKVLGREIAVVNVPPEVARAEWLEQGFPEMMVNGILKHMGDENGIHGKVFPDVEKLAGRPARTFQEWAAANADAFR